MDEKIEKLVNKIIAFLKKHDIEKDVTIIFKKNRYSRCIDASTGKINKNARISEYKKNTVFRCYINEAKGSKGAIAIVPTCESRFYKILDKGFKDKEYEEIMKDFDEVVENSLDRGAFYCMIYEQIYDEFKRLIAIYM